MRPTGQEDLFRTSDNFHARQMSHTHIWNNARDFFLCCRQRIVSIIRKIAIFNHPIEYPEKKRRELERVSSKPSTFGRSSPAANSRLFPIETTSLSYGLGRAPDAEENGNRRQSEERAVRERRFPGRPSGEDKTQPHCHPRQRPQYGGLNPTPNPQVDARQRGELLIAHPLSAPERSVPVPNQDKTSPAQKGAHPRVERGEVPRPWQAEGRYQKTQDNEPVRNDEFSRVHD